MERNHLDNFGRGSPKEHSFKIISKSIHRVRRNCLLSKRSTDRRHMMHDGRRGGGGGGGGINLDICVIVNRCLFSTVNVGKMKCLVIYQK